MALNKWLVLAGLIPALAVGLFTIGFVMQVQAQTPSFEIVENQEISVNDEVSRTIIVKLADGVSSADALR